MILTPPVDVQPSWSGAPARSRSAAKISSTAAPSRYTQNSSWPFHNVQRQETHRSWPNTLKVQYARGAEKLPMRSYTTTGLSGFSGTASMADAKTASEGTMCGSPDDWSATASMLRRMLPGMRLAANSCSASRPADVRTYLLACCIRPCAVRRAGRPTSTCGANATGLRICFAIAAHNCLSAYSVCPTCALGDS